MTQASGSTKSCGAAHADEEPRQKHEDKASAWRQVVPLSLIFLAACCVFFNDLGKYPLFNPDEGLFAEPAREILDTGEWVTSLLNYVVRYTKPPLLMWVMAASYKVFGVNEFAARLFGTSCAALVVACVYCFLSRYAGRRAAIFGSSTLIVAPLFAGTARMAITDLPLTFFFAGSMMCFYRSFAEKSSLFRWLAYVLVGLAVMTKGPVAVLIPVVILFAYHFLRGDLREAFRFYQPIWGALIVAVIAVPWFAAEIAVTKGAYFQAFILRENFQRFSSVVDSHKGGWWYHLLAMSGGFLPWFVFVPQALYSALVPARLDETGFVARIKQWLGSFRNLSRRQDLCLFAALWAIITLAFFSASVSKLMTYTLPAFPALAILVGAEITAALEAGALVRLLVPLAILAILYGTAGAVGPFALKKLRDCPPDLFKVLGGYVSFQCAVSLISLALTALRRPAIAIGFFALLTLGSTAFYGQRAISMVSRQWEGALPDFARYAAATSYPVLLFDLRKPGAPFYTRRQVIQPGSRKALEERLAGFENAYVITKSKDRDYFQSLPGCRIVSEQGYLMLVGWKRPPSVKPIPGPGPGEQAPDLSLAN